jgi:predicted GNAT family acetyltransferase
MGSVQVHRHDGVADYLAAAGTFLEAREAEHNLILGLCTNIRRHPELFADRPPHYVTVTNDGGTVVAAAIRTPPFNQVLSEMADQHAELLADALADEGDTLPGVLGPTGAARRFVDRWEQRTGLAAERVLAERIFRLSAVIPPRPAGGSWRVAGDEDRALLAAWYLAFAEEATPEQAPVEDLDAMVDRWVRRIGRTMYLWEDGGRPASLAGAGGETPNGTRIGPVYTPPELRGRGYASNLVAAVSQAQLDAGRRFCFLFTDLANPTSNKIYQQIGYEPVTDVDQYRIGPA